MQLQPGIYLQGDKYRIIRTLGNGGFGITYLAEHELAGRNVCIKEFFPKEFYNRDEDSRSISLGSKGSAEMMDAYKQKFMKEAKTIARLDHPNIIHIHDVFAENNTAYYVMEYIDGESLNDLVKRRGALSEAEAIKYIRSVAEAIGYIHERKIMHLDIKPANVMLRKEDGRAIVIDFGLSKQYDAEGNQTSSTPVGISAGYAPMEQYQQGGVREFSPETDIYSLGATLYYLVTGKVPPQAVNIADEGLPTLPSNLSIGVCNAIERSMEIQRKRRPHSVKEFLDILGVEDLKSAPKAAPAPMPVFTPAATPQSEETKIDIKQEISTFDATDEQTSIDNVKLTPKPQGDERPVKTETQGNSRWLLWSLLFLAVTLGIGYALNVSTENEKKRNQQTAPETETETVEGSFQSNNYDLHNFATVVYDESSSPNIEWDITTEPAEDGLYKVTFDGTIKEGFHGYAMNDFSAPIIEFENAEVVGDIYEPLTPETYPDDFGGVSYCYYNRAIYVYTIRVTDTPVRGYISATTCKDMACTQSVAYFVINSL